MKKVLLIIIDNLTKGGAEVMLVGILPELSKTYNIVLVTLTDENHFPEEDIVYLKKYTLGFNNKRSILSCVWKLRNIINEHQPALIHSHLYYSNLIAKTASPKKIPLIYTLHSEMSKSIFNKSRILTFFEKITIKKGHMALAVSNEVLKDYKHFIKKDIRCGVLKNYIQDFYFSPEMTQRPRQKGPLKLIAVGNIKEAKNYEYLLDAFKFIRPGDVYLHIYGRGDEQTLKAINKKNADRGIAVFFKGVSDNLQKLYSNYDLFVSSSRHEGFGLAAIEAMASGLPLILSDIPVYHEITRENALFFDLNDPRSFPRIIDEILGGKYDLSKLSHQGYEISDLYRKDRYVEDLYSIYKTISSEHLN